MSERSISLRGVRVHNLKEVDLDLPHRKLIVLCGVSGSGKTSLALDTLYTEGQRRYIDSFSAYTRQFLQRLEKPDAERIDGIPPAIAVTRKNASRSSRATVGTATEIVEYLRLLYAKIGHVFCRKCGQEVLRHSSQSVAEALRSLPADSKFMVAYSIDPTTLNGDFSKSLVERGFVRVVAEGKIINLTESPTFTFEKQRSVDVIVDRLAVGSSNETRLRDSLESAFAAGNGLCVILSEAPLAEVSNTVTLDGRTWHRAEFSHTLLCSTCGIEYPTPEPRLYSFNSPLGACPECEGFGNVVDLDWNLIVPDPTLSIRGGAVAPWNTPAYSHELDELKALASDYGINIDCPFSELTDKDRELIRNGVPERKFGGLNGFFAWLERRKYKMHLRVFLSRWRSYKPCPACHGTRLQPEALATRIGGLNIGEVSQLQIREAVKLFDTLPLSADEARVGRMMLDQVRSRLAFLANVGVEYLSLDRTLRTLSGGELARVTLTTALGSSLVNMLYVLDEPSVGLHPCDVTKLVTAVERLRDGGNTVVLVEHEEAMIRAADQIVEIGPGAGERGGQVVFQGSPEQMLADDQSLTGDYLTGRRGIAPRTDRRVPNHGWIRLAGARGNNLKNVKVEFPLGVMCLVTGVSGAGKSTLIQDTLYPALCRRLKKPCGPAAPYDDIFGDGQIEDVMLVDQSPIGRSPRSNPVTYLKAFDEIRDVFAETVEARTRNLTPANFSFNVDAGRCTACEGDGYQQIDMQFLADVFIKCPQCQGRRYRADILEVKYRGRSIADVLDLTVREAFTFFRGRPKVQGKLKRLIDVGLDYLRLGQPANTLSGGESQRLKLALYMTSSRKGRTLFLLDEPTTGLHFHDIVQLLDCFEALLAVGHSLIIVEHNLQMMKAADYLIDLGPGAADRGGTIVAEGTPEQVARVKGSVTGKYLAAALAESNAPV